MSGKKVRDYPLFESSNSKMVCSARGAQSRNISSISKAMEKRDAYREAKAIKSILSKAEKVKW